MKPTCYVSEHKELEQRVAELEASIDVHLMEKLELIRRAEKAEALVADAKKVLANLRSQVLVLMSEKRRAEARVAELEDDVRVLRLKVGVRAQMVDALASRGKREG